MQAILLFIVNQYLNTLVSFFDGYMTYFKSIKIYFGFYTVRNIGKEKKSVLDDGEEWKEDLEKISKEDPSSW
ncbi:hypothetical protein MTZ49_04770 [Entomomonas sp. E2T0]|uniref:hypothetical protein n=1 Tax=Entomomonas sp. E2T0 TaxID=2930213 RepID=UPI0022281E26|nr:hypothetical protein [Entomomonas sp. E2T0]UYZ84882.1 hypothetical protein MTZ49_04770 [Entomomonas sp. E2T0]